MNFFGVGPGEALLVLVIALMVVGPSRFPEIAREAGRWYRLARRYSAEVMTDVRAAVSELESEIGEPGDDLRSVRDLGAMFRDDVRSAGESVSEIGRETHLVAEQETARAVAIADAPEAPPAAPASPVVPPENATDAPVPVDASPITPADVSIRPSRRTPAPGTPVDPFAALEAKRARERAHDADDAHS
jgi:sec-independent protein translocase protein TatB